MVSPSSHKTNNNEQPKAKTTPTKNMTSNSPAKKTITVLGSTGGQGGSVVDTFLNEGSFLVRGVTSNVESETAKKLAARGVEMVAGNVKEPSSLSKAFEGSDIAFIVVNFWDPEIMTKEGQLTKQIMDVAKKAGVRQVIFSSLANVGKVSKGKIDVPHFTLKAEAWDYLQTLGFESVTAVEPAAYYSNWFTFFKAVEEDDGTLVWTWPGKNNPVSQFDVNTGTGPSVLQAALHPDEYNGKFVLLEGDLLTVEEIVAKLSKKLGKPARVNYADPEEFSKSFPGAHEIAQMVEWFDSYGYYGPETPDRKHSSGKEIGGLMSFDEWLDSGAIQAFV